jgi:hypothetical protein
MDRREFLKMLGLGGVALTLPKPLGIVAARAAELEAPPLHVGRTELAVDAGPGLGFAMYGLAFDLERGLSRERCDDFFRHWALRLAVRHVSGDVTDMLHAPAKRVPTGEASDPQLGWCGRLLSVMSPQRPYYLMQPFVVRPGETLEFWLRPFGARFPMPEVTVALTGFRDEPNVSRMGSQYYALSFRAVRVERAAAIRMGLVGPEEPEEDFARPEEGRQIIRAS